MTSYFLAIDIGASSGRHILGSFENGALKFEEIHRFDNGVAKKNGHLCWDVPALFASIKEGMKKCVELGKIPESVGIDTWGVDFVLLDEDDQIIGDTVAYRDSRTNGMDEVFSRAMSEADLYAKTGIQKQLFNTVYQLTAIREQHPDYFEKAKSFLMIPDYFHYLLCGVKSNEYTNASTSGMLNAETNTWDADIIAATGAPASLFLPLTKPGTVLGPLTEAVAKEVGFTCNVIAPCTHDTGSAVAALPTTEGNALYISSGTWSLLGTERLASVRTETARNANYTNEGGYNYRYRILKNIMGLWMIQNVRKELSAQKGGKIPFDDLDNAARESTCDSLVDCNEQCFLAPASMITAIKTRCAETGQTVPESMGDLARVVYRSLAACYKAAVKELETIMGCTYRDLYIIGGGSKSMLLNEMTAQATGLTVHTGPSEATAIGNLVVQMIAGGVFPTLEAAREQVRAYVATE